jgi:hypothetical protein
MKPGEFSSYAPGRCSRICQLDTNTPASILLFLNTMLRSSLKEQYHHLFPKHNSAWFIDRRLSINMTASSEELSPFLGLPAELCIAIYNFVIDDCTTTISTISDRRHSVIATCIPASYNLAKCSSFIVSCRLIFSDFEKEWVPAFGKHVRVLSHLPGSQNRSTP